MSDRLKHPLVKVIYNINQYSCPLNINLHMHTIYSDGSLDPISLLKQASKLGLQHFAITDHHSITAYKLINSWKQENNINFFLPQIWSGIEISCILKNCLVHIIGLGFDIASPAISPYINNEASIGLSLRAENVIKAIKLANGLSILAHPARYRIDYKKLIDEAYLLGINGVEVWYDYSFSSNWKPSELICNSIDNYISRYNLLKTCGTDTHGYSLLRR
ncbi:PHP domain-containing protein [Prochlorococcus marinus]|uniref:PHP domain-containing protein n=1 Tax=Prochlorococcus marinus TaxID=1219 RepID=UPI0022B39EC2|nr:PHP domain-containing protein [Prochlorococcus marinus]